jgi:hypothetical protein
MNRGDLDAESWATTAKEAIRSTHVYAALLATNDPSAETADFASDEDRVRAETLVASALQRARATPAGVCDAIDAARDTYAAACEWASADFGREGFNNLADEDLGELDDPDEEDEDLPDEEEPDQGDAEPDLTVDYSDTSEGTINAIARDMIRRHCPGFRGTLEGE